MTCIVVSNVSTYSITYSILSKEKRKNSKLLPVDGAIVVQNLMVTARPPDLIETI